MEEVTFIRADGSSFSVARDIQAFSYMFGLGVYDFRIGDTIYYSQDWRGREIAENLFGQSVTPTRSLFGSFPY